MKIRASDGTEITGLDFSNVSYSLFVANDGKVFDAPNSVITNSITTFDVSVLKQLATIPNISTLNADDIDNLKQLSTTLKAISMIDFSNDNVQKLFKEFLVAAKLYSE